MKNQFVALAGAMLLAVACKKEATAPLPANIPLTNEREALAEEPVTPLNQPLVLPAATPATARAVPIPVIMVHGLGGFGSGEMGGLYHYWGGLDNIPVYLTESGFPAFAAKVGPMSSNRDRALELYYYIKGGYVDYGRFHSARYGHAQTKPRYFPGIYPEWDGEHPIHLLGHSMGGLTARKLVTLLEQGDALERRDPEHAAIFGGGKTGWVKSVTTISTPHNGATLNYILLEGYIPLVRQLVTAAAALAGIVPGVDRIYDFGLEQWGLEQQPGESWLAYAQRVQASSIWQSADVASHDTSPEAAVERQRTEPDSRNVYYFSISNKASLRGLLTGWEYPRPDMFPVLSAVAFPMPVVMGLGNYTRHVPGCIVIDAKWWPNDGAANTYGMSGPAGSLLRTYNPQLPLEKGVWYHLGQFNGYDHFDMIGIGYFGTVRPLYLSVVQLLNTL